MRVLVIEDSRRLREAVSTGLRRAGFAVDYAGDGEEGLWLAQSNDYDVVILDLMLPKLDGLEVLRRLRAGGSAVHVLILTARDEVHDRVQGLGAGADDYLVKPFAFEELIARVQALVRRQYAAKNPVLDAGGVSIDTAGRRASWAGADLPLTPREYALLELLTLLRGNVVSRTKIERHIYDERADPMSNVVDSTVCSLRRKLQDAGAPPLIETRRGEGYLLP
jgi:DNA-binding response OmpR family regulator